MITYIYALLILAAVLVSHVLGLNGLYMGIRGYDVFVHILGGLGIGLFLSAFVNLHFPNISHKRTYIILGVLVFGLVWELFEIYFNIAGYHLWTRLYYLDTAKDLVDDLLGGTIIAFLYAPNSRKSVSPSNN